MQTLIMAGQLILALSILVFIHELGHFMAAKAFGIRVDKFYIFFDAWGKKLFSFKKGETEYGIGWLPLGGYVKIAGMIDESMDKDQLKKEPESWEFRSKPNWQKFIVMVAGVVMNIILGVLLYAFYLGHFEQGYVSTSQFNEDGIYAYQLARDFGFQSGDKLLEINGKHFDRWNDFNSLKVYFGADVTVERDGNRETIHVPGDFFKSFRNGLVPFLELKNSVIIDSLSDINPNAKKAGMMVGDRIAVLNGHELFCYGDLVEHLAKLKGDTATMTVERGGGVTKDLSVAVDTSGKIGFYANFDGLRSLQYTRTNYNFGSALKYGARDAWEYLYYNAVGLGKIFTGDVKATESVQSPIGIAKIFGPVWDWGNFWRLTAILSMVLAFMNILPIPALDGGHIMFIGIETIIGRKLSDGFMEKAQLAGMIIILALMVFAFGNDIFKIFKG